MALCPTSDIWKCSNKLDQHQVQCKLWLSKLKYQSTTSTMQSHMLLRHKGTSLDRNNQKQQPKMTALTTPKQSRDGARQEKIPQFITAMIIKDMLPFECYIAVRHSCADGSSGAGIPALHSHFLWSTVNVRVEKIYEETCTKLKASLAYRTQVVGISPPKLGWNSLPMAGSGWAFTCKDTVAASWAKWMVTGLHLYNAFLRGMTNDQSALQLLPHSHPFIQTFILSYLARRSREAN